ncbi:granzyme M-like [Cimex lectularius]|uniref:Peptidase S1 domain-containing protein n=1 Tax=Cimex lectularius TaxID=79782 RepID=A0A8I6TMK5_CIMLE|nr:granzyme M-like [Cimex lectularius]
MNPRHDITVNICFYLNVPMFMNSFSSQLSCSSRKHALLLCAILFLLSVCSVIGVNELESKIIGGRRAHQEEFPYVVCVRGQFLCSGVLVDLKTVLTATRCFYRANRLVSLSKVQVIAGAVNLADSTAQTIGVSTLIRHEKYLFIRTNSSYRTEYDIGMARLLFSFEESPTLKPYSVFPFHSAEEMEDSFHETQKAGSRCWMIGFGLIGTKKLVYSMQVIEIYILPDSGCQNISGNVNEPVICAQSAEPEKVRAIGGDFGNPLVCGRRYFGVDRDAITINNISTIIFTPIWPYLEYFNLNLKSSGTVPSLRIFWCLTGFLILAIIYQL